jgi:NTE family protein
MDRVDVDQADATSSSLPGQTNQRPIRALCLSGGGFRAALFHLGALRRLNELGILSSIDTISSVSGGSIIAAHLAHCIRSWPAPGAAISSSYWEEDVAKPFRVLVTRNLRTGPLLRRPLPWNWRHDTATVEALEKGYKRHLTTLKLGELPDHPNFVFCATDMTFGVNWLFEKCRIGDYQVGYMKNVADYPVARAVAASSCFPPIFNPMVVGLTPNQLVGGEATKTLGREVRDSLVAGLRLTDGGVYDNMGFEPVWKTHEVILASDGGAPFNAESDTSYFLRIKRYVSIINKQAASVRRRWLMAAFRNGKKQGAYWGIDSAPTEYVSNGGYPKRLVEQVICKARTDLDAFSDPEISVLENHGYLLADSIIQKWASKLLAINHVPLAIPHSGKYMDPDWVAKKLSKSHKVRLPGRWRLRAPKE